MGSMGWGWYFEALKAYCDHQAAGLPTLASLKVPINNKVLPETNESVMQNPPKCLSQMTEYLPAFKLSML